MSISVIRWIIKNKN